MGNKFTKAKTSKTQQKSIKTITKTSETERELMKTITQTITSEKDQKLTMTITKTIRCKPRQESEIIFTIQNPPYDELLQKMITSFIFYNPKKLINQDFAPKICKKCDNISWYFNIEITDLHNKVYLYTQCVKCYYENPLNSIFKLVNNNKLLQNGDQNVINGLLLNDYECYKCGEVQTIDFDSDELIFNGFFQNNKFVCPECILNTPFCEICDNYMIDNPNDCTFCQIY